MIAIPARPGSNERELNHELGLTAMSNTRTSARTTQLRESPAGRPICSAVLDRKPAGNVLTLGTDPLPHSGRASWRLALRIRAIALLPLTALQFQAQDYAVTGRLSYSLTGETGDSTPRAQLHFRVSVDGCRWSIQTSHDSPDRPVKQYEVGYDGTNLFTYVTFAERILQQGAGMVFNPKEARLAATPYGALRQRGYNTGALDIEANEVPKEGGSFAAPVWLGFASGCYLKSVETNRLKPIWHLDDPALREEGFTVNARWEAFTGDPGLPRSITYLNDGLLRYRTKAGSKTTRMPPPYDRGFTEATFEVGRFTNYNSLTLPLECTFKKFVPVLDSRTGTAGELRCQYVIRCVVESLARSKGFDPIPVLDDVTAVNDRRVAGAAPGVALIQYDVTNAWRPPDDKATKRLIGFQANLAAAKGVRDIDHRSWRSRVVLLVLVGVSFFPVIVFLSRWKRNEGTVKKLLKQ